MLLTEAIHGVGAGGSQRCDEHSLFLPIVEKRMMQEVARGQPNGLATFDNGADDVGCQEGIADCLAHAVRWDGVFGCNLLIGFACFDSVEPGWEPKRRALCHDKCGGFRCPDFSSDINHVHWHVH